jgi:hypothetical protein
MNMAVAPNSISMKIPSIVDVSMSEATVQITAASGKGRYVNTDHTATLTCKDGNGKAVYRKAIEHTDFPLPEITLYFRYFTFRGGNCRRTRVRAPPSSMTAPRSALSRTKWSGSGCNVRYPEGTRWPVVLPHLPSPNPPS